MTLGPCDTCGATSDGFTAFVRYEPEPNETQADTDWGEDLPPLYAVVCQECGSVREVFDKRRLEEDADT